MKTISDLTKEQVIEIAELCYPHPDWRKSDFEVIYQPYDETWLSDAAEYWSVKFDGYTFADKIDTYRMWIHPTLNIEFDAIRKNTLDFTKYIGTYNTDEIDNVVKGMLQEVKELKKNNPQNEKGDTILLGSFPVANQHQIHKKFIEWGIEPVNS